MARVAVQPPEPRQPKLLRCHSNYHDASDSAQLESTFRQGADTWAKHLVTSAAGRAATFGMILIVSKVGGIESQLAQPLL